jgi:hypothetical protein
MAKSQFFFDLEKQKQLDNCKGCTSRSCEGVRETPLQ